MQIELLLVVMAKALAELAGMFLLGRGLLWVLAGRKRMENVFYQVLAIVTDPLLRFTRWLAPRVVLDSHIPLLAFGLVLLAWVLIVFWVLPEMCTSGYDCSALIERKRAE
jgi:hypothetical protein